jgi:tellurite methyltransferase
MKPSLLLFLFLFMALGSSLRAEEEQDGPGSEESTRTKATRLMALTGDNDFADERTAWDKTYARADYVFGKDPTSFLVDNVDKLPKGRALDIATGEGRNAVFLAKKGFRVDGVDISTVGLRKAKRLAAENGVKVQTINADLKKYTIKPETYSVIMNFFFLQRNLFPQIIGGLKKGGVVIFESHTLDQLKLKNDSRTWEKEFLLEPGELKKAFSSLEILAYEETNDGQNAVARLIARKK